jgi:dynein heavy chain
MEKYTLEQAKTSCGNVAGLEAWSEAMHTFFYINKEVLPLKANLAVAEGKLQAATKELNAAQAILDEKQAELDVVQAEFDATMRKKKELQDDADACNRKMSAASALIGGLGGEKVRWTAQSKLFAEQTARLVGDVLIMCAFMSYSGPFNAAFRAKLANSWTERLEKTGIPKTKGLNVISELVDNVTAGEWALEGLPVDDLSLENGIITTKATRYPLMVDPQGQGKNWIRNRESKNGLCVTSLNHKYFRTHLEDSLGNGKPLLIEDVGEFLDPCLDNVLSKNFIKSGSTFKVKVGDKECDVMNGFALYITTKLANPAYTPEVFAACSIIDFTVTMKGLEDQLLARVILFEKAELEEERLALSAEVQANKKKMKELEDNLLYKLVNTKGSLVDDESLITVLRVSKTTAEEVSEKLTVAEETNAKISVAREEYRPVAVRGSIVYFLIVEMSMVNVMYQTSLDQFLEVFTLSMERSNKSPVPATRIENIINYMTYAAFCYTIRGLYARDKFTLTILLALKIDMRTGFVKPAEFMTFIKGGAALDLGSVEPKPKPWILDMTWLNLVQLSQLAQFSEITNQVTRNDKVWKNWFDEAEPEESPIPDGYDSSVDTFRKLLLIRSWCPDRTLAQARKYIADSIGDRYAEAVLTDMELIFQESTSRVPMVCLLSPGSDPTAAIQELSKVHKVECRDISMGQGQEVAARRLVATFQEVGGWVLLQNCHLCLGFLAELQDTVRDAENVHDQFRLWITSEEHPKFPINLLQASIKFTNEPPAGLKAGIKRTFAGISQERLDISSMPQWKPMLFGVAFLHSTVQERRKYGPNGWNIPYEFNQGDLDASIQMVQNTVDDMDPKKGIDWKAVCYHLGEVQYGGRVTDDRDKRLLNTYAANWFNDRMLQPDFVFYKDKTVTYHMANFAKWQEYAEFIEAMPLVDKPGVFGMHNNTDIAYQTRVASSTLGTILDIQPKDSGGGGGETREEAVTRMCNEFLEKLPPDFIEHECRARYAKMGQNAPMNIFLRQEVDRMQKVIGLVRETLQNLLLAIDGTIIMSANLADALNNMYDARVPTAWLAISWLSSTLGFWFTELVQRYHQFHSWVFGGRPNSFWLTGFFNANGFITAMRQEVTRAHKGWALDSVVCANEVTKMQGKEDCNEPPKEGVYVYGLFLDGAGWNKRDNQLAEQQAKVLFVQLPVIHIFAINSTGGRDVRQYECPIYRKPRRTDLEFVTFVDLKSKQDPMHWTLRGVALLCDTK